MSRTAAALLQDGTLLDPCEIFHDGESPVYSTLRYMGEAVEEKLDYDPSLPLKEGSAFP